MADLEIKSPKEFNSGIRGLETTDRGHPDTFNPQLKTLINNDAYLKEKLEEMALTAEKHEKNEEIHVTLEKKEEWDAEATPETAGKMSAADKKKLDEIAVGAEMNQNAFGNVKVGSVVISADGKTAQVELVAGDNVVLTGDNAKKRVTIAVNIPSTLPPSAHTQSASTITGGVFQGNVAVNAGTDYTASIVRNARFSTAVPTSLTNGEICFVYEA